MTDGCHYARQFGAAKIRSEVEAARHRRRFPHHVVAMIITEVYLIFGENTAPLFDVEYNSDEPPF